MNDWTDQEPPQMDPYEDLAEALLYSDPQTAGEKLRKMFNEAVPAISGVQHAQALRKAELDRSLGAVAKFKADNPEWDNDGMISAAVERGLYDAQREDLIRLGMDPDKLPTNRNELANIHLAFRSDPKFAGRVRSAEQQFEDAAAQVEEKFGVQRRIHDPQQNAKRRVNEMIESRAKARGIDPQQYREQYSSRTPDYVHSDVPVTPESVAQSTLRGFGEGGTPDAERRASHKSAFERFYANRTSGAERRPGAAVQVSRSADDRRFG